MRCKSALGFSEASRASPIGMLILQWQKRAVGTRGNNNGLPNIFGSEFHFEAAVSSQNTIIRAQCHQSYTLEVDVKLI